MEAQAFAQALSEWFAAQGRDLPWRRPPRTPYRVLVAEVMLQQTRVEVVAERFEAFLHRFPDFAALAGAPLDDVLRAWEGLGYYRRAEALWRAAALVASQGMLPAGREELMALPGVGGYSASAVRCFAHDLPDPPLDANLLRIALRLLGTRADPRSAQAERAAQGLLAPVLAAGSAARLGDALMDLGATVCVARSPRCGRCPLRSGCRALASGDPESFGRPAGRPERRLVRIVALRIESPLGLLWRPRPRGALLGGLWEPPHVLAAQDPGEDAIAAELAAWGVVGACDTGVRRPLVHVFTHRVWQGEVRRLTARAAPPAPPARWLDGPDLAGVAMPKAFRAVLAEGW